MRALHIETNSSAGGEGRNGGEEGRRGGEPRKEEEGNVEESNKRYARVLEEYEGPTQR